MAIFKEKVLATGITVNYWRIGNIRWQHGEKKRITAVFLEPFINQEAAKSGKFPIGEGILEIPVDIQVVSSISLADIYKEITSSRMELQEITPAVMNGEDIVTHAVTEMVEKNEFANASFI